MTPEAPFDPGIRMLTLRERSATYTEDGSRGPAIVLLHGLPGSVRDFRWLGAALRAREPQRRVVRIDMPGCGGTDESLGGKMTVEERASFVLEVVEALDLERIVVAGHSLGGPVALAVAALAPERVTALTLMASVGLRPHRVFRQMPRPALLARVVCNRFGRRYLGDILCRHFVRLGFPRSTPTSAMFVTLRGVGAVRFATIRAHADRVAASGLPSRVFLAEDDPFIEREIAEELAAALGADLRFFAEGGHNIQKTHAAELARLIVERPEISSDRLR
jgi:pimeloyl-ACP methyl ester carboxylesterase